MDGIRAEPFCSAEDRFDIQVAGLYGRRPDRS
jgi:hypothetical protein